MLTTPVIFGRVRVTPSLTLNLFLQGNMRIFRLGERVKARIPEATQIGSKKVDKLIRGQIISISPNRKFAKLLLDDDDTELLIETRLLR